MASVFVPGVKRFPRAWVHDLHNFPSSDELCIVVRLFTLLAFERSLGVRAAP